MAFPPHTFATQSGNVPAQQLDDNFAACMPIAGAALSIKGNPTGAGASDIDMTAAQAYSILKSAIPRFVTMFLSGLQAVNGQQLLRAQFNVPFIITQANCLASAGAAATGSSVFVIADNGTSIGTVTFAASGTVGTVVITASPYTLAAGRVLTITGPNPADATLGNINVTLGGVFN